MLGHSLQYSFGAILPSYELFQTSFFKVWKACDEKNWVQNIHFSDFTSLKLADGRDLRL